jgi:hypothetical protein
MPPLAILALCLALCSGCAQMDKRAFSGVDQAGRAIVAAFDGKIPLPRYRELVAAFSAEVVHARAQTRSSSERTLLDEYDAAEAGLNDLLAVWQRREEHNEELLPIAEALPARLAEQYQLPVNTNEPPSIYATEAIHAIWDATRATLSHATRALNR